MQCFTAFDILWVEGAPDEPHLSGDVSPCPAAAVVVLPPDALPCGFTALFVWGAGELTNVVLSTRKKVCAAAWSCRRRSCGVWWVGVCGWVGGWPGRWCGCVLWVCFARRWSVVECASRVCVSQVLAKVVRPIPHRIQILPYEKVELCSNAEKIKVSCFVLSCTLVCCRVLSGSVV